MFPLQTRLQRSAGSLQPRADHTGSSPCWDWRATQTPGTEAWAEAARFSCGTRAPGHRRDPFLRTRAGHEKHCRVLLFISGHGLFQTTRPRTPDSRPHVSSRPRSAGTGHALTGRLLTTPEGPTAPESYSNPKPLRRNTEIRVNKPPK